MAYPSGLPKKRCPGCDADLDRSAFGGNRSRGDGLNSHCRTCVREASRRSYQANKQKVCERQRRRYAENPEAHKTRQRERREARPFERLAYRYGLDEMTAQAAWERRGDGCRICGSDSDLHFDHSHDTGQPRDWLCGRCNKGLGLFKDRPDLLVKAAEYLADHKEVVV